MAVDLSAIKSELNRLENPRSSKRGRSFFSPREDDKTYRVRIVAFPDNEGKPFKSIKVYKNIKGWIGLSAPYQFDKDDPVQDVIDSLHERRKGTEGDEAKAITDLVKKLYPRDQHFALVLDRDDPEGGLKLWRISNAIVQQLYSFFLDQDYGDISHWKTGYDIKVKRMNQSGKTSIQVTPSPKSTPLCESEEAYNKLLENMPDFDAITKPVEFDELQELVTAFVKNGGVYNRDGESSRFTNASSNNASSNSDDEESDDDDSGDVASSLERIDAAFSA